MAEAKNVNNRDWDAKGDILVGTADNAFDQLAVGADETTVVADAAQAMGRKNAFAKAGGPYGGAGYKSLHYYQADLYGPNANAIPAEARMYVVAFPVRKKTTFDRIATFAIANGTAGAVLRLGIYADDGFCYPGALVVDAGTVAMAAGAPVTKEITISQSLDAGIYWLAAVIQGVAGTRPTMICSAGTTTATPNLALTASPHVNETAYTQTGISGALPNPFTVTPAVIAAPIWIWMRAA